MEVRKLEEGVKDLKDLIQVVHKNQIDLSAFLLEKGIYAQELIKFADPNLLEEEKEIVRKAEFILSDNGNYSLDSVQFKLRSLKEECFIKNKTVLTLIRGIQSDVPAEFWEQVMNYNLGEAQFAEEFDHEKIQELARKTSLFLANGEKASRKKQPDEEQPSEERQPESESEAPTFSDTDVESVYMTGQEDFQDCVYQMEESPKIISSSATVDLSDTAQNVSFIQHILNEDSLAAVAVVDLFVAVKTLKESLDTLSRSNNEVFHRITELNRESKVFKEQYGDFLENVKRFLAKMKEDEKIWGTLQLKGKSTIGAKVTSEDKVEAEEETKDKKVEDTLKRQIKKKASDIPERRNNEGGSDGELKDVKCRRLARKDKSVHAYSERSSSNSLHRKKVKSLGCFLSAFRERSFSRLSVLSEALLSSFLASLYWLQQDDDGSLTEGSLSSSNSSFTIKPTLEEIHKGGKCMHLRDSAVQLISDICEVVDGSDQKLKEPYLGIQDEIYLSSNFNISSNVNGMKVKSIIEAPPNEISCLYYGQKSYLKAALKQTKSKESLKSLDEMTSEEESDFEEALTDILVPSTPYDLKAKPSVTCMGNLTTMPMKSRSPDVMSDINFMPSWIEKVSTEINSKLKKRKSKTNVRILEQPYEKADKSLKNLAGYLKLKVPANTPKGVLDVTVVKYKRSRLLRDSLLKVSTSHTASRSNQIHGSQLLGRVTKSRENDYFVSEQSLRDVDSEVISNSGDSELEEFIEIFHENPKRNRINEKLFNEKGTLKMMDLKSGKPHFFKIQKSSPVYHVQEFLQKKSSEEQEKKLQAKKCDSLPEGKTLYLTSGMKEQKQLVIEGSSSSLLLYIQVEVEGCSPSNPSGIIMEYDKNSLGTQTIESRRVEAGLSLPDEIIRLKEEKLNGKSLFQIWRGCEKSNIADAEDTHEMVCKESLEEKELSGKRAEVVERVLVLKGPREKTVTFNEELSEIFIEREIQELQPEEEKGMTATVRSIVLKETKHEAHVWIPQNSQLLLQRAETRRVETKAQHDVNFTINLSPWELQNALKLIREIENDVIEVKLSDAISILPLLETELRKHLQGKIKALGEKESSDESCLQKFFSALDFLPQEPEPNIESPEGRLNNLMCMISNLEQVVRLSEYSVGNNHLSQHNSSKIYTLLRELTTSIRDLEDGPNMMSLSQTLEIASQLDTAVREFDSLIKIQPADYVSPDKSGKEERNQELESLDEMFVMQHLKNVRQKVFEVVGQEAIDVEGRIEKDFNMLGRLEIQNNEVLMFLEAFLQKTERRVTELASMKAELKTLSSSLKDLYENMTEIMTRKKENEVEMEVSEIKELEEQSFNSSISSSESPPLDKAEPVKETVSSLLLALHNLKSRAREKKEVCKEILHSGSFERESENSSQRSSKSSFTTKNADELHSTVTQIKKIGHSSLYLAWTKPESPLGSSIVGYQIYVNGKLNQKVRNPQRLQAVLYSVDLTGKVNIQLYAVGESGPKILLANVNHQDE